MLTARNMKRRSESISENQSDNFATGTEASKITLDDMVYKDDPDASLSWLFSTGA